MLILDNIVVLNQPKTGSSFVREVLKNIHKNRLTKNKKWHNKILLKTGLKKAPFLKELLHSQPGNNRPKNQHGKYYQIPKEHLNKKIVSVVRNPYDKLLSIYEFRDWVDHPLIDKGKLFKLFPTFPNIGVIDLIKIRDIKNEEKFDFNPNLKKIGFQTITFLIMFSRNPQNILRNLSSNNQANIKIALENLPEIYFLRQENLNQELYNFLIRNGYTKDELIGLKNKSRVNITKDQITNRNQLWTSEALKYVEEREELLFNILASKGIHYNKPTI